MTALDECTCDVLTWRTSFRQSEKNEMLVGTVYFRLHHTYSVGTTIYVHVSSTGSLGRLPLMKDTAGRRPAELPANGEWDAPTAAGRRRPAGQWWVRRLLAAARQNGRRARPQCPHALRTCVVARYTYVRVLSTAIRTYVVCRDAVFNSFRFYRENGWLDCATMKPRHLFWVVCMVQCCSRDLLGAP